MDPSSLQFVWLHRKSERLVVIAASSYSLLLFLVPFVPISFLSPSSSFFFCLFFLKRGGPDKKMDAIDGWMDAMVYKIDEPISFSFFYFSCYYVYIIAHVAFRSFVCLFCGLFFISVWWLLRAAAAVALLLDGVVVAVVGCGKLMWHNIFCFLVVGEKASAEGKQVL